MPRDRQRGNSLLLALIVMSALATLGAMTVVSVQSSLKASTNDRSQAVAMYAAESGAAMAMDYLRTRCDTAGTGWSAYVVPNNDPSLLTPMGPANLAASGALPGTANNPFSTDQNAWFSVTVLNNPNDPNFAHAGPPNDTDCRVTLQVTGHGPQGATAIIEWDIMRSAPWAPPPGIQPNPLAIPVLPFYPLGALVPGTNAPLAPVPAGMILLGWHVVNL
ncbi:MAG TPA: hypothetical protein VH165_18205 [Kofleriaceae bacterium]|jgi:type II secretory pathway pseudopilin PulG|nr:hypothetical protein [Kofleriaceae bacterium]